MLRRVALVAFALALPPALALSSTGATQKAEASVSLSVSLDQLVERSTYAAIGKASDRRMVWEQFGESRRIVTYTRVDFDRTVFGKAPKTAWVRTLGGSIGKIGQSVSGEARFALGQRALFFLVEEEGVTLVVARAQGHFIVKDDETLAPSPDVGGIVHRAGPIVSAHEELVGTRLEDAVRTVVDVKARNVRP